MLIKHRLLAIALLVGSAPHITAQQTKPVDDDVLRTSTELVQSAVTVLDKSGHFVEGLTRDQFEVVIDGKPRNLSFFERITAGTAREGEVFRNNNSTASTSPRTTAAPTIAGRTIVFFIDDLHLSPESLKRTRQMLRHFIEGEMSSSDNVAIASASGQLGFLEQYTTNKLVLDAAVDRLMPRPYLVEKYAPGTSGMTEHIALAIENGSRSDDRVLQVFVEECMRNAGRRPMGKVNTIKISCENQVRNSARAVLLQAAEITRNTYATLASLMRSSARVPGRKLAFFISDGFLLDNGPRASPVRDKLEQVIDEARRSGVVVYSIHARGLVNPDYSDPSIPKTIDGNGRLDLASTGELESTQDALNALARDTGGRALRNTNYFESWVSNVLDETSNYYLLAWRPELDLEKDKKFRNVKISVVGRPDLTVRAPRGFVVGSSVQSVAVRAPVPTTPTPEKQITDALSDFYGLGDVPTQLALTYLNTPASGSVITSSVYIGGGGISYGTDNKPATLQLAGVVLNDKGKVASSFRNQLTVNPPKANSTDGGIFYTEHSVVSPGIYQVRIAVRDEKSSRVGSAMQWMVVPDLTKKQLAASSVLFQANAGTQSGSAVQLSVNHAFSRTALFGYWLFVYNAKKDSKGDPHLIVQSTVMRGGQTVLSNRERKVDKVGEDPERVALGERVLIESLPPGRYDLKITIKDDVAGSSVTQTDYFVVR